jgi:type IV pilus assembly protein PilF
MRAAPPVPRNAGRVVVAMCAAFAVLAAGCTSVQETTQPVRDARAADGRSGVRTTPASPRAEARMPDRPADPSRAEADERRRAQIRLELAAGFYQQANYAQALEELRAALAVDPNLAAAHGLQGLVLMDLGDRARAEESFRRALAIAPEDSEILNNYGWFLCQTDRPREGILQFQAALRNPLYSTPARPLHNAGVCSLRLGDAEAAEGFFQRSFQLDPRNPVAMYHLGEIYLRRNDLERARFHSQRLLSSYPPSAETLWLAIRVDRRVGDRDSVASLSSQLRRQFPSSREATLLQRGAFGE